MIYLVAVLGAVLGSFLLTLVDRLNRDESWVKGRSRCEHCRATLGPLELVPVLSFVFLRGRCRHCRARIALSHLLAELGTAALLVLTVLVPAEVGLPQLWLRLITSALLAGLFLSDVRHGTVPDVLSVPAIVLLVVSQLINGVSPANLALAMLVGGSVFLVQLLLSRGRWVGSGDVRLGLIAGALLGWPHVATALFVAYVGGALIASALLLVRVKKLKDALPMGAFLIPAVLVVEWYGQTMLNRIFP